MWKLFVSAMLILPIALDAQPRFELGLTGGVATLTSLTHVYKNASIISKDPISYNKVFGYSVTAKALVDFRVCELGVGIEGGAMNGTLHRVVAFKEEVDANLPYPIITRNNEIEEQKIAAPYIAPNLFFHFKINFSDRIYLYTGPIGGRIFSKEDMSWNGKSTGWIAGGNLGLVIKVSDRISIDIAEGWRMAWIRDFNTDINNRRQWYNAKVIAQGEDFTYVALSYNTYNMSYASSAVGIRFRL